MIRAPRVEVVIPNLNGERWLPDCLDALGLQAYRDFRATVVDNGSTDGSIERVRERPGTQLLRCSANLGFSAAVNRGIATAQGEYVALLNNDARPTVGWLGALVEALDLEPRASAATSKILSLRQPGTIDNVGDGLSRKGIPYPVGHLESDVGQYEESRWVFGACGGAALYRRSLFDDVGLFDERFFAYHEDVDLSFRAQLLGHPCLYVPGAVVHHIGSATTGGKINRFTVYHSTRNTLLLLAKNLPARLAVRFFPRLLWGQVYWFLKMAVREGEWGAWAQGVLAGLVRLPAILAERRRTRLRISTRDVRGLLQASEKEIRESIRRKRRHVSDRRENGEPLSERDAVRHSRQTPESRHGARGYAATAPSKLTVGPAS